MRRAVAEAGRPGLGSLAASLGFRRVEQVRILVRPGATVAEVTGVVHRYPRTVRVPLPVAHRLARDGAPLRIEHAGRATAAS